MSEEQRENGNCKKGLFFRAILYFPTRQTDNKKMPPRLAHYQGNAAALIIRVSQRAACTGVPGKAGQGVVSTLARRYLIGCYCAYCKRVPSIVKSLGYLRPV